jgi:hypothetical protein
MLVAFVKIGTLFSESMKQYGSLFETKSFLFGKIIVFASNKDFGILGNIFRLASYFS